MLGLEATWNLFFGGIQYWQVWTTSSSVKAYLRSERWHQIFPFQTRRMPVEQFPIAPLILIPGGRLDPKASDVKGMCKLKRSFQWSVVRRCSKFWSLQLSRNITIWIGVCGHVPLFQHPDWESFYGAFKKHSRTAYAEVLLCALLVLLFGKFSRRTDIATTVPIPLVLQIFDRLPGKRCRPSMHASIPRHRS